MDRLRLSPNFSKDFSFFRFICKNFHWTVLDLPISINIADISLRAIPAIRSWAAHGISMPGLITWKYGTSFQIDAYMRPWVNGGSVIIVPFARLLRLVFPNLATSALYDSSVRTLLTEFQTSWKEVALRRTYWNETSFNS